MALFRDNTVDNIPIWIAQQEWIYKIASAENLCPRRASLAIQDVEGKHSWVSPAILMSHASAISKPPPNAAPSIAAIVGTGRLPTTEDKTQKDHT